MNKDQACRLVKETFQNPFDKNRFLFFARQLLNGFNEEKAIPMEVPHSFIDHVCRCSRMGTYRAPDGQLADILIVETTESWKLERTRTALRDFVAHKLKRGDNYKEAGLVAFVSPDAKTWRFSFVRMDYSSKRNPVTGKIAMEERLTPARRYSYLVGENESCHTAQSRFLDLLKDTNNNPTLENIEKAFSVESVTKEFFEEYKALFLNLKEELDLLIEKDKNLSSEFTAKNIRPADFAKKLMGQIVFLYFLQKKGWLGVPKGGKWGDGPRDFMRHLANGTFRSYKNFFDEILEPLFYNTLAFDRGHDAWCDDFNCRIPFLNGGLFEPQGGYDWEKTKIIIPNKLFSQADTVVDETERRGILDVFDRYNFTVNEAEPLEKEVAIDPEMLGKVFENLLEVKERKSKGSFYTPREIVHYMCQESLINYLDTAVNSREEPIAPVKRRQREFGDEPTDQILITASVRKESVPRNDIELFIRSGDQASHYEAVRVDGAKRRRELPKTIETNARLLDDKLADISVCDPAIGSGAFPVGMMQEIVRARSALTPYFNDVHDRTAYHFKRHAIQQCLYGVDIDPGAVEIAKLRLWLSLVVDEEDVQQIKPLPNLDYKIVTGNSLLGVEKSLFNNELFIRLEKIKPLYFDETDREEKHRLKKEIDEIIDSLTNGKQVFDFEIYFSEVFHRQGGFDVVIGNPPYGFRNVLTPKDKKYFREERRISFPTGDVAELFICIATEKLTRLFGTLTFIIPKKSLYGESWVDIRKLWLMNSVGCLMDASQAFDNVLLEQVAFLITKNYSNPAPKIIVGRHNSDSASIHVFGKFPAKEIFSDNLRNAQIYKGLYPKSLIQKIYDQSFDNTENIIHAKIGASNITADLTFESDGNYPCVKGIDIERYGLKPRKRYLKRTPANSHILPTPHQKLIAQEIIAHIENPYPHIHIAMFLDDGKRLFNDTCVEIQLMNERLDPRTAMAYFHSTFANWYAYNFVYNRAIRTMHFIDFYVTQIVFPKILITDCSSQKPFISIVDAILEGKKRNPETSTQSLEQALDNLVYKVYGLTRDEIAIVEGGGCR